LRALGVTSESAGSRCRTFDMIERAIRASSPTPSTRCSRPAGTPPDILAILVREARAAFQKPERASWARQGGFEVVAGTPEQLAARVAAEIPAVRELVAKAGIKPE